MFIYPIKSCLPLLLKLKHSIIKGLSCKVIRKINMRKPLINRREEAWHNDILMFGHMIIKVEL